MSEAPYILAIDQGTTSTRAMIFDRDGAPRATAQRELPQIFPRPGWVEHDPEEIWRATLDTCRAAMAKLGVGAAAIAALGITNQRETTVLWERASGRPIANAIVWQDRRTAAVCERLRAEGAAASVAAGKRASRAANAPRTAQAARIARSTAPVWVVAAPAAAAPGA